MKKTRANQFSAIISKKEESLTLIVVYLFKFLTTSIRKIIPPKDQTTKKGKK